MGNAPCNRPSTLSPAVLRNVCMLPRWRKVRCRAWRQELLPRTRAPRACSTGDVIGLQPFSKSGPSSSLDASAIKISPAYNIRIARERSSNRLAMSQSSKRENIPLELEKYARHFNKIRTMNRSSAVHFSTGNGIEALNRPLLALKK